MKEKLTQAMSTPSSYELCINFDALNSEELRGLGYFSPATEGAGDTEHTVNCEELRDAVHFDSFPKRIRH